MPEIHLLNLRTNVPQIVDFATIIVSSFANGIELDKMVFGGVLPLSQSANHPTNIKTK